MEEDDFAVLFTAWTAVADDDFNRGTSRNRGLAVRSRPEGEGRSAAGRSPDAPDNRARDY